MSRLNQKDKEILNSNQVINLNSTKYAYLGGEFGTHSNDYLEVLIYSGDNFLESAVVENSDYVNEGVDGIRIKTGTILVLCFKIQTKKNIQVQLKVQIMYLVNTI